MSEAEAGTKTQPALMEEGSEPKTIRVDPRRDYFPMCIVWASIPILT